jgi:hypothetical protein
MKASFLAVLMAVGVAYAGVNGTTVLNYSVTNNTGGTGNDLHVDTDQTIDSASSPDFSNAAIGTDAVQFSNGDIASGSSATFTLGSDEGVTPLINNPQGVIDYCWADPGADATCSAAPSAKQYDPLYFDFDSTFVPFTFITTLDLETSSSTPIDYTNLVVTQDGQNLLLGAVDTSGSVDNTGLQLTGNLNFNNGPIDFSVDDTTNGLTINGSFTAIPEPATTGICVLMLLAMIVTVRRRQVRNQ